jgi:hypothetical protein
MLARPARDRGGPHLEPSTGGPIRLADHDQVVRKLGHARQERNPEGAGAEEGDASDRTH